MLNICISFEDDYYVQAVALISSLLEHNKHVHLFAFTLHLKKEQQDYIESLFNNMDSAITFIDCTNNLDIFEKLHIKSTVDGASFSTYFRLLIADMIPNEIDRFIYLDCDMIVFDSLEDVYQLDMQGNVIAACLDIMVNDYKRLLNLENCYYFNGGFLMVDAKKWRERDYTKKAFKLLAKYPALRYCDQDVMNIILKGDFLVLPVRYNFMIFYHELCYEKLNNFFPNMSYYSKEEYEKGKENPVVVHYVYSIYDRPWFKGSFGRYKEYWVNYANKNNLPHVLNKRKCYSRTSILQFIYKVCSKKLALSIIKKRNKKTINQIKNSYEEKGYVFE